MCSDQMLTRNSEILLSMPEVSVSSASPLETYLFSIPGALRAGSQQHFGECLGGDMKRLDGCDREASLRYCVTTITWPNRRQKADHE